MTRAIPAARVRPCATLAYGLERLRRRPELIVPGHAVPPAAWPLPRSLFARSPATALGLWTRNNLLRTRLARKMLIRSTKAGATDQAMPDYAAA